MFKRFLKHQIKSFIAPIIVIATILIIEAFIVVSNERLAFGAQYTYNVDPISGQSILVESILNHYYPDSGTNYAAFTISGMFLAIALVIYIYSYRFSSRKGDFYLQNPYGERTIKNTRIIIGIVGLIAAITLATVLYYTIYSLKINSYEIYSYVSRNFFNTEGELVSYIESSEAKVVFNFSNVFCSYLVTIVGVLSVFFTSSFIVSKCNTLWSAILIPLVFNVIITFASYSVFGFWDTIRKVYGTPSYTYFYVGPFGLYEIQRNLLDTITFHFQGFPTTTIAIGEGYRVGIAGVVIYVVLSGICGILTFVEKEPSGEVFGKVEPNLSQRLFHHTSCALIIAVFVAGYMRQGLVFTAILLLIAIAFYFFTTVSLNRTFKLKAHDIIPMAISAFFGVFEFIILITQHYPGYIIE